MQMLSIKFETKKRLVVCYPHTDKQMGALWEELKNWRHSKHWNTRKFFLALIFGLLFTLLDAWTDFVFAENVPDECPGEFKGHPETHQRMESRFHNHCGHFISKGVKFLTYTFIALPGVMLSFSALQSLLRRFWNRICGGSEVPGCLRALFNAAALLLQMSFCTGLILVSLMGNPLGIEGYENMIRAMAYSSATFLIGVKLLGTICHGPEVTRLVEKATDAEVRFEAALQLILLGTIYLVSGKGSYGSCNSAITSLLVMGKVGVQNFFNKHEQELSKASVLGRIYIAISVLPVFVLTALFKIGSFAIVFASDAWRGLFLLCLRGERRFPFPSIPKNESL